MIDNPLLRGLSAKTMARTRRVLSLFERIIDEVRRRQRDEGNFDCFGRAKDGFCDQTDCSWRDKCLPLSRLSNEYATIPIRSGNSRDA